MGRGMGTTEISECLQESQRTRRRLCRGALSANRELRPRKAIPAAPPTPAASEWQSPHLGPKRGFCHPTWQPRTLTNRTYLMPGPEGKEEDGKAAVQAQRFCPFSRPSAKPPKPDPPGRGDGRDRAHRRVTLELSTQQRRRDTKPQHQALREPPLALPQWPQGRSLHPRAGQTLGSPPRASAHTPGRSQLRCQGCQLSTLHICRKLTRHTPCIHTVLCTFQKKKENRHTP